MKNGKEEITVQFLGAAGTVTGSKYLITVENKKILVDCGMFQGLKKLRDLNWAEFTIDPAKIDLVLLTHGHLDHVGYLPRLVSGGFKGPILGTSPTLQIAKIILEDSAKIQEEEAERANRFKYSKHEIARPLYTIKEAEAVQKYFIPQKLKEWIVIADNISVRFRYNGHIIGATFIELKIGKRLLVFSGDIGRENDVLLYPPDKPERADYLFIESTYGGRLHSDQPEKQLTEIILGAIKQGGIIIVPSFAVERAQALIYILWKLKKEKAIPNIPVYLDSPMGEDVLDVFLKNTEWHKLPQNECMKMCKGITLVKTVLETLKLAEDKSPKIVIAGGGMGTGGRVLSYFQSFLGYSKATILLVGYQAEGTRGRQLLEGAKEIKLYGKYYRVKSKIENLQGLSAHADQAELLNWVKKINGKPKKVFIVHGESTSADSFRVKLETEFSWNCIIPELNQIETL
jgi:metallo-beta-lactamase family protein